MPADYSSFSWTRKDSTILGLLLTLALLLRLPHLLSPYVINTDAIGFIEAAKSLQQEGWASPFRVHPSIFPLLIGWIHSLMPDWVTAARLLPLVFGVAAIIPLYLLSKELLPHGRAWIVPLLYTLTPAVIRYSTDVVRDPIFWFWSFTVVWCLLRGTRTQGKSSFLFFSTAGMSALLASLFRVEGLTLFPLGVLIIGIGLWRPNGAKTALRGSMFYLLPGALLISAWLLFAPTEMRSINPVEIRSYSRQLHRATSMGKNEGISRWIERQQDRPLLHRFLSVAWKYRGLLAMAELLTHWIRTASLPFFLLFCIGCFVTPWSQNRGWVAVLLVMICWLSVGYIRTSGAYFAISKRHLVPLAVMGHLFAAQGLVEIQARLRRVSPFFGSRRGTALLAGVLVLLFLPTLLLPHRQEKLIRRRVGEWIATLGIQDPVVVTDRPRIAFYAGGKSIPLREFLKDPSKKADLIVLEARSNQYKTKEIIRRLEAAGRKLKRIHSFQDRGGSFGVYAFGKALQLRPINGDRDESTRGS